MPRSDAWGESQLKKKKKILKFFANLSGKKPALQALNPLTFLKRDSNTSIFL